MISLIVTLKQIPTERKAKPVSVYVFHVHSDPC